MTSPPTPSNSVPTLVTLPKELLLQTIECLPVRFIRNLALTFNKRITTTCLAVLEAFEFRRRSHKQRMVSRFGTLQYPYHDFPETTDTGCYSASLCRRMFSPSPEAGGLKPSRALGRLGDLDYLDLDGDLDWLQPVDKITAEIREMRFIDPQQSSIAVSEQEMRDLQSTAGKVHVHLPPAFVNFFTRQDLLDHMPGNDTDDLRFVISGGLRLVPKIVDGGLGGCILQFCRKEEESFWSLYIEPGPKGAHCVLNIPAHASDFPNLNDLPGTRSHVIVTDEEEQEAKLKGLLIADLGGLFRPGRILNGVNFEEWLATTYFEHWLLALLGETDLNYDEAVEPLRKYMREVRVVREGSDVEETSELENEFSGDMMEF
ncbi:hypothetical protein BDV96DRAFT_651919 [Lophiotrema nucula]|uniref:Uncharacterized protein n=1 Tax=Lophiotrema nucula TaxID=690887 RepID=A0A6A5YSP0_9PLEO|nr:hypothetical protein BDV96DRAFT_651919 [Lophiotrema nucula]